MKSPSRQCDFWPFAVPFTQLPNRQDTFVNRLGGVGPFTHWSRLAAPFAADATAGSSSIAAAAVAMTTSAMNVLRAPTRARACLGFVVDGSATSAEPLVKS